ncbi:hypothetical protein BSLG_008867 [Batrachochytrium salamandrivorans]|nr:hypothetical protein BSLG_008867 [Batrachochytrium salamandrivorans]
MESDYTSNALSRNSPNSARKNSSVKAIVLEPVDQIIASMTQQLNSDLTHHIPPWMGASDTLLKPDSQVSLHSQARQPEAEIRADLTGDDKNKRRTEGVPIDPIEGPIDWVGSVKAGGTVSTITSRFHNGPEHPAQDLERKARIRTLMKADKLPHLPPATIGYTNNLLNPQLSSIARLAGYGSIY